MRFDIVTIFPHIFDSYLSTSILSRASENKKIRVRMHDLRSYSADRRHKKVDDRPYGGGAGMVLQAEPILKCVSDIHPTSRSRTILFSAKGKSLTQRIAQQWATRYDQLIFVTGRYEGIDERVVKALRAEEISIGPYVLTDGDIAAMVVISAVARLIPGVIRLESLAEESHRNALLKEEASTGQLEYPHYTRPEVITWRGKRYRVPNVLLSGDHKRIAAWRKQHQKPRRGR